MGKTSPASENQFDQSDPLDQLDRLGRSRHGNGPAEINALPRNTSHNLEVALEAMPVAVSWANLHDSKVTFLNRRFTEMLGYTLEDLPDIAAIVNTLYPFPEDVETIWEHWTKPLAHPHRETSIAPMELRVRTKDGDLRTILHNGVILPGLGCSLVSLVDITERRRHELLLAAAERRARENETMFRTLLDHSPEMIVLSPFDRPTRYVSPAVKRLTGFSAEEYLELPVDMLCHPEDLPGGLTVLEYLKEGALAQVYRFRAPQKAGGFRWMEGTLTGYRDSATQQVTGFVATIRDIADQKEREDLLASRYQLLADIAALDELTGIANRRTFNQAFARESSRHNRVNRDLSLLLIDVDHFKQFNDTYGHLAGDECLRKIAAAFQSSLSREADLVARFGGEEFVALLPSTDRNGATVMAQRLLEIVRNLAICHRASPHGIVTVSAGVVTWAAGQKIDRANLISQADRALYEAKKGGRNTFRTVRHDDPESVS